MNIKKPTIRIIAASAGLLFLILDSKTALTGALEGINLCIYSVIPTLFPFFVLSGIITSSLSCLQIKPLKAVGKLCGIPLGMESLLIVGLLGGYPVGAQNIYHMYRDGLLNKNDARRMLGFCNNAGPAFIFGIAGCLFRSPCCAWVLWIIHIISAILVGMILPQKSHAVVSFSESYTITLIESVVRSIRALCQVCSWIVLFRIILAALQHWILWLLPDGYTPLIYGSLELVNGFHALYDIPAEGVRFMLSAAFLAIGGGCIAMQTLAVTHELGAGWYFPGKILQCLISLVLAFVTQLFLFDENHTVTDYTPFAFVFAALIVISIPYAAKFKKIVAFPREPVYNK